MVARKRSIARGAAFLAIASRPRDLSLARAGLAVTQLSADRDGTTSERRLAEARARGNHSEYGFYGRYPFDGTPGITRTSQIDATVRVLIQALRAAAGR